MSNLTVAGFPGIEDEFVGCTIRPADSDDVYPAPHRISPFTKADVALKARNIDQGKRRQLNCCAPLIRSIGMNSETGVNIPIRPFVIKIEILLSCPCAAHWSREMSFAVRSTKVPQLPNRGT